MVFFLAIQKDKLLIDDGFLEAESYFIGSRFCHVIDNWLTKKKWNFDRYRYES